MNVLGADIARRCLELGELDEVLAIVAPVLLGRRSGCSATRLTLRSQTRARGGWACPPVKAADSPDGDRLGASRNREVIAFWNRRRWRRAVDAAGAGECRGRAGHATYALRWVLLKGWPSRSSWSRA